MADPVNSFTSTQIARAAAALYDLQLGETTMIAAQAAVGQLGSVNALVNQVYNADFASQTNAQAAAIIVRNVGITTASGLSATAVADAEAAVAQVLGAAAAGQKGAAVVGLLNLFSQMGSHAVYGDAATAFNAQITAATGYASIDGTPDIPVHPPSTDFINISSETVAGATAMRLTGNQDIRLDFGNTLHQIRGLDLDGDGVIEQNGQENNFTFLEANNAVVAAHHSGFAVVDAYARNPLNITDGANNFLGNIYYDGTGFFGDGKATNGNIFLGGLASDQALGGIGNDFFAGGGNVGGVLGGTVAGDFLSGGRNADFFFAEMSRLSATDGNNNTLVGGTTSDDTIADAGGTGGLGTMDNDWILLEASDDDEPVTVNLTEGTGLSTATTANGAVFFHSDIESLNASGNLYGFLNNVDTVIGARASDGYPDAHVAGTMNYGRGSTAQLRITGSAVNNAIIGGYDNDLIDGGAGDDLLMGGDLQFLITNRNNPNLLDASGGLNLTANSAGLINDGKDSLTGAAGNDNIVFESDGGTVTGGVDTAPTSGRSTGGSDARNYAGPRASSQGDALWLTNFSMGRLAGATLAGEATAQQDALSKLTSDLTYRMDLGNDGVINFRNYGGAAAASQDNTNYATITSNNGTVPRVATTGMESVNATGLGAIDYKAAGSNTPDLVFNNQQNYFGLGANVDLRGNGVDNVLLASSGNDTLEGRGGDDVLSGNTGNDRFVAAFGDGVDWVARPVDANGDSLWDTTGGLVVTGGLAWGQDFRPPAAATAGTTTLVVDFGTTILNGVDTFVATFQVNIDGVDYGTTIPVAKLAAAKTTAEVAAIVNPVFQETNAKVSVVATSATTIEIRAIDSTPGDGKLPVIGTSAATGFFVTGQASGVGTYQAKGTILGAEGTNLEDDRLVIKTYEDRSINLGMDQTKFQTSQAVEMVANFTTTGSQLVQGQANRLFLSNVREGDTVSVTINEKVYSYTLKAGEQADQAATGLANAINRSLDINSASGRVAATADAGTFADFAEAAAGLDLAGVTITQTNVLGSMAYMNLSATVSRADGATPFGSVATHNQSNTEVQLLGFDGRNGALFSQDKDLSPVVLFQGRNTGTTTTSLLLTAKNAGGALNGMDATLNAAGTAFINGDDLLFGGTANDVISGKTGDDRIIMSKGVDTVDGGGNSVLPSGATQVFQDVLQAEEGTFGTGTSFKVTLSGTIGTTGAGTVTAVDSKGVATGDVTTFTNIELVRVLENNRLSELDVKALSDSIAAAVGTNPIISNGPSGLATPAAAVPDPAGTNASDEGLYIAVTDNPSATYSIDANNNGVIDRNNPAEQFTATAVLGTESVTSGNANDFVFADYTQITANNKFDLGGQQSNDTTLREGADWVIYNHLAIGTTLAGTVVADRPVIGVSLTGPSAATVKMSGGMLGTDVFTDTLVNVEVVSVTNAATGFTDTLDVSAIAAGVTINYGAQVEVGKSNGGTDLVATTAAAQEADKLETGGLAPVGAGLGNEWLEIAGITTLERVTGSAGNDRVIVADVMGTQGAAAPAADNFTTASRITSLFANRSGFIVSASTAGGTAAAKVLDNGLYRFDLGAGIDTLDYSQETQSVGVLVDTTAGDKDMVLVGSGDLTGVGERIDWATGVERYFGGAFGGSGNGIDLSNATVNTTIQFSKEASNNLPANDAVEPNGFDVVNSNLTRAAEVRDTANNTVFATFVDRTGNSDVGMLSRVWDVVYGSKSLDETVVLTDNESTFMHWLLLDGGMNTVSYNARTNVITAAIGAVDARDATQFQQINADGDVITQGLYGANATNFMSIVGSARAGDTIDVTGLDSLSAGLRVVTSAGTKPTLSQVDPRFNMVNLNTGVVTEAVFGQWSTAAAPNTVAGAAGFFTRVSGFENASNAGNNDVVHLIGDGGRNSLTGGTGDDFIVGGRGTAGDGSADVGLGNRGDNLSGGAGADWFIYNNETESPGGSVTGNQQSATAFPGPLVTADINVINSRDTIGDFVTTSDKLVFNIVDTYDAVRAAAAVPGNLGTPLNSFAAMTTVFAAGSAAVNIPIDATLASIAAQVANYDINTMLAGVGTTAAIGDLILRVQATSASDVIDMAAGLAPLALLNAAAGDGLRVDVVYTDKNQSQAGGFDQLIHFTPGNTADADRIDLSFLKLARYEVSNAATGVNYDVLPGPAGNNIVDALEGAAATTTLIRALGAAPVFAVNGSAPNLFIDGTVYRPIAIQTLADGNTDPSATVFIDVNGDGNYVPTDDMVVVLVGVDGANLVNANFIMNQYGGVFGG